MKKAVEWDSPTLEFTYSDVAEGAKQPSDLACFVAVIDRQIPTGGFWHFTDGANGVLLLHHLLVLFHGARNFPGLPVRFPANIWVLFMPPASSCVMAHFAVAVRATLLPVPLVEVEVRQGLYFMAHRTLLSIHVAHHSTERKDPARRRGRRCIVDTSLAYHTQKRPPLAGRALSPPCSGQMLLVYQEPA